MKFKKYNFDCCCFAFELSFDSLGGWTSTNFNRRCITNQWIKLYISYSLFLTTVAISLRILQSIEEDVSNVNFSSKKKRYFFQTMDQSSSCLDLRLIWWNLAIDQLVLDDASLETHQRVVITNYLIRNMYCCLLTGRWISSNFTTCKNIV